MYIYVTKTKEYKHTTQSQSRSRSLISNKYIINIISVSKSSSPSISNLNIFERIKKNSSILFIFDLIRKIIINNR